MTQQYGTVKVDFLTFTSGQTGSETDITIPVSGLADIAESGIDISGDISARNITATGDLVVSGQATVSGLTVDQNAIVSGNLGVSGTLTTDDFTITGVGTTSGAFNVSGLLTASGLTVLNQATVSGLSVTNLAAVGTLTTTGSTVINGSATLNSGLTVNNADVDINSAATIASGLTVENGGIVVSNNGGLNVDGNVIFQDNLTVSGSASFDDITATGLSTFNEVTVTGNFSVDTVAFASGTEAAPSISFVGDTDTGFYNAAANEVRITTSGNDRLTVDSSGNVGIGTTSPGAKLDAQGSGTITLQAGTLNTSGSEVGQLRLFYLGGGGGTSAAVFLRSGDGYSFLASETNSPLLFGTNSTERARIDSTGQLSFIGGGSSVSPAVGFNGSAPSNSLVIDSTGLVGIGVSSPSVLLQSQQTSAGASVIGASVVNNSVTAGTGVILDLTPSTAGPGVRGAQIEAVNTDGLNEISLALKTSSGGGTPATRLHITPAGNVGIGTTSPSQKLYVSGGDILLDSNKKLRFGSSDAAFIEASGSDGAGGTRYMRFVVNSEFARIDASGNFLIGTSESQGQGGTLQVGGSPTGGAASTAAINAFGFDARLRLSRATTGNPITIVADNDSIGQIAFDGYDGSAYSVAALIAAEVDGTPGPNTMPGSLIFSTTSTTPGANPTERMRINSSGQTGIFCSSANAFYVSSSGAASASDISIVGLHSAVGTYAGTASFIVRTNGNVENTNNSYGAISDIKLKENIVDANSQWDDLKSLQVRKYNFKEETGQETHTQIGLVAQEAELVSPGLVSESPDRDEDGNDLGTVTKSVNYSVLYMKAVKALQEAMERIEVLEQRLNDAGIN